MALVDSFTSVTSDPKWYKGLKLYSGSCLDLYDLLQTNRGLIHELGPNRRTVLHKGVHHGCVKLVKFVLVEMFNEDGKCHCKAEDNDQCGLTREELLRKTDRHGDTAVNIVLVSGSPKMMKLLKWAIEVSKCEDSPSDREESDDERYSSDSSVEEPRTVSSGSAPEVDDDVFIENSFTSITYGSNDMNRAMYDAVYDIIAGELEKCGEWIDTVKERIKRNVDFQFVPSIELIILHFLFSAEIRKLVRTEESGQDVEKENPEYEKIENLVRSIIEECRKHVLNEDDWMVVTLFNILDPQGRTVLHAAYASGKKTDIIDGLFNILKSMSRNDASPLSEETISRCFNAADVGGRTLSHMMSIYDPRIRGWYMYKTWKRLLSDMDHKENERRWDSDLMSKWYENSGFHTLCCWCSGNNPPVVLKKVGFAFGSITPLHLSIIFDNHIMFKHLLGFVDVNVKLKFEGYWARETVSPFQLASILGRPSMVEEFMKHYRNVKNVDDEGFGSDYSIYSAIHCAAMCGRSDTVQMILRHPIYDPICQTYERGTSLHALVGMDFHRDLYNHLKVINELALCYALPSSHVYKRIKKDFILLDVIGNVPRKFTDDEKTCINLLIQGGIDIWTTNEWSHGQEFPSVTENGNNEARAWWFEKVVKEVEIKKASITSAANATSVIGALVATASFIGPLQPPSSYGDGDYLHMSRKAIQVYLVCNNFSFFFSIASILMAVLPAIPMSKESLYDEMLRSERCLKTAVAFLLVSIICIIASFTSASIAVVSPQWHERKFVVVSTSIGVVICLFVLVIHIIRLLRMVYHKNTWLRRKFARHMYF